MAAFNAIIYVSISLEYALSSKNELSTKIFRLFFQPDQILGKMHSEFANVDQHSEEYKSFWADLRKGTGKSNTGMYKLFSGKEIWPK